MTWRGNYSKTLHKHTICNHWLTGSVACASYKWLAAEWHTAMYVWERGHNSNQALWECTWVKCCWLYHLSMLIVQAWDAHEEPNCLMKNCLPVHEWEAEHGLSWQDISYPILVTILLLRCYFSKIVLPCLPRWWQLSHVCQSRQLLGNFSG